jgi:aspartyl-tRNA(Asn)/glutamyl-tRNA(Gln) amidotransferase subunit A
MGVVEEKVRKYLKVIREKNKKINAFLLKGARALDSKKSKGKLYGYVFAVKSNINVLGLTASCASRTLEDYKSTYDASVIERIKAEDGLIIGMTNCDEFASGSSGENSAFGPTENPVLSGYVSGGSSSGSAAAVAAGMCDVSLGSDTGGSIRTPASFCGIVGVKPSYGAVSRHGLIDLSMSLDQIGPFSRSVSDAELVMNVISGKDEKDPTNIDLEKFDAKKKEFKIGVVRVKGVEKEIQKKVDEVIGKLGWKTKEVSIKYIDLAISTYHVLCWTEFFSATRRFDGRKYGLKIEDVCGPEIMRRLIGGSEIAKAEFKGKYYDKALAVKEVIACEFDRVLKDVDCIVMPTVPVFPWKIGAKMSVEDVYATDALAIPANLAGVCSVSLLIGNVGKFPVGMQVICARGEDFKMLSIAREIEKLRFN